VGSSSTELFEYSPDVAITKALHASARRLGWLKKEIKELQHRVEKLYAIAEHFKIKTPFGGHA
jgi:hypothetical protein